MGRLTRLILLSWLAATILAGCNFSGCINNQNSIPLAGFYSFATLSGISVPNLTVGGVGAPGDSLIINNASASSVYLPFRSQQPETSFFFHYNQEGIDSDAFNDTLTFVYTSVPYFASEECGAMFRYVITSYTYTKHLIDSVGLVDSVITNVDRERIRIYFRTALTGGSDDEEGGNEGENEDNQQQQPEE